MNWKEKKYTEKSDEELMLLVDKSDKNAFTEIYKRYSKKMLNYFHKMLNYDRPKAEDMTQSLFMIILEKPGSFDPKRKFPAWLYTIASNMCKNEYRNMDNNYKYRVYMNDDSIINYTELGIDRKMFKLCLVEELKRMDFDHKSVFILRYREGLSIKEISEITGVKEGTVKSRLFYTLKTLEKKLKVFDPKDN